MSEKGPLSNLTNQPPHELSMNVGASGQAPDTTISSLTPYQILPDHLKRTDYDPQEVTHDVRVALSRVRSQIVGRDELLTQTLLSLLTREHQLLYSRPGTAKSLYASTIFEQFSNARTFHIQMTKGMTEEALVGAINIQKLTEEGVIHHNTEGTLVRAHFAFTDEILDANDSALRATLGIFQERKFFNGQQVEDANLHTAIAASNYLRETQATEAVLDRFLFKAYLPSDADPYTMMRIDAAYETNKGKVVPVSGEHKISYEALDFLTRIVEGTVEGKEIHSPHHVLFLKNLLILEYKQRVDDERKKQGKSELYISPRTVAKARKVLNASALLNNRMEVKTADLDTLKYLVCTLGDGDNQEVIFDQSRSSVLRKFTSNDYEMIDNLMLIHEKFESFLKGFENGERADLTMVESIKKLLGLASAEEITFDRFTGKVNTLNYAIVNDTVDQLRNQIKARIMLEKQRYAGANNDKSLLV